MTRRVSTDWREIPKDVKDIWAKTGRLGSTARLSVLKRNRATVVTPLSDVRKIANTYAKRNKVKVIISKNKNIWGRRPAIGSKKSIMHSDACAIPYDRVYLHPIIQYSSKKYIRNVLDHEMDHVKVNRREKESLERRGFRIVRQTKGGWVTWVKDAA